MTRSISMSRFLPILGLALLFGLLAYLAITYTRDQHRIAAIWLPNAVLIAFMLRRGRADPLQIAVACAANIAANLAAGDAPFRAAALSLVNSVEIAIICYGMRLQGLARPDMLRFDHLLAFVIIGGLIAPATSGLIAASVLAAPGTSIVELWLSWALTDALGLLIVAPAIWVSMDAWQRRARPSRQQTVEWLAIMGGGLFVILMLFTQSRFPLLFVAAPVVLLAAFRLGGLGATAATVLVAMVASVATALDVGPIALVQGSLTDRLHVLQAFLAVNFAMSLPVAAILESRAEAVRALAASEERNRSIVDNMREVVFQTDAEGRWTFLNPAWEAFTGYSVQESIGWRTTRLLHPDDIDAARNIYPDLISGAIAEATLSQRFRRRDGEWSHIEVSVRRLVNPDGRFLGTSGNIRDVTPLVLQQHALRESEARFRRMAEAAPVGIFRADAEGQVTYVNAAWCAKIGLNLEQSLGNGWMTALADVTAYLADPPWQGFRQPGNVKRRIARFRGADNADLWVETVNTAEFDDEGRITGYIGVVIDITEQRLSAERLADSERRFEALAKLAPAGIFRASADGGMTYVNPDWLRMTGLGEGGWEGDAWQRAIHPQDRDRIVAEWTRAVVGKREFRSEFRWIRPDGSTAWLDAVGRPELGPDGNMQGYIGVALDITERRAALDALAERDAELSLLADNATDAIVRMTLAGECLYASPSATELFELPPEILIGQNLIADFHPDDDVRVRAIFDALAKGATDRALIAFRSASPLERSRYRWMEAHCALLRDPATNLPREIIASLRDVSANKQLEAELRDARERAEQAAVAKSAFLANMSHEIRTPMNGVIGFTELLQASDLAPTQRQQVDMIADSGRTMMRLLNDILDISKIEAGQMQIAAEPFDLRHLLRGVVRLMEPSAHTKNLEVRTKISDDTPERIVGDPLRLRQILLNLVGNAIKFTEHGHVAIAISVDPAAVDAGLQIDVSDSGIGIAPERIGAIFDIFAQEDTSTARRFGGSGLGLSITRQLVELMHGSINVHSDRGSGSTFTVRLPLHIGEQDGPIAANAPTTTDPSCQHDQVPLILVAEDNDINQALMRAMAAQLGYQIVIAANGLEAVRAVEERASQQKSFDVVFMDVQMPIMDGLEATKRLRDLGFGAERLPIVALTANAYADDIAACREAGMQHHLSKPISVSALNDAFKRFGRRAGGAREQLDPASNADLPDALRQQYHARKSDTLERAARLANATTAPDDEWESFLDDLHRLAGTAGFFEDTTVGDAAGALEHELRDAEPSARSAMVARYIAHHLVALEPFDDVNAAQ